MIWKIFRRNRNQSIPEPARIILRILLCLVVFQYDLTSIPR